MSDQCKAKTIVATVQENGIIREANGRIIGRVEPYVKWDDLDTLQPPDAATAEQIADACNDLVVVRRHLECGDHQSAHHAALVENAYKTIRTHSGALQPPDAGLVEALEGIKARGCPLPSRPDCGLCPSCIARQALANHRQGEQWVDQPGIEMRCCSMYGELWTDINGAIWANHRGQWYGPITPPGGK